MMEKEKFIELLRAEVDKYLKGRPVNEEAWKETLEIFEESYPEMGPRVLAGDTTWERCINDMLYVYHMNH